LLGRPCGCQFADRNRSVAAKTNRLHGLERALIAREAHDDRHIFSCVLVVQQAGY
jgi:hypothetical protein